MGTPLTGTIGTDVDGLLKTADNLELTTTLKQVGSGDGSDSPLYLATDKIGFNEGVDMTKTSTQLNATVDFKEAITASAAELNILDGATLSTTELNYVDGVTSAIQTQIDAKASLSALSTEASTRAADDTTLAGLITTEASTRSTADSALQSNINSEATARDNADTTLQTNINAKEATANKDATGGYVGLTLFKINFKNALNTFTSFFTNANTAARTYTFPDYDATIATVAGTETLTNKRLTARVQSVTSSATVTPNSDTDDLVIITAQAASLVIENPTGTPTEGQALLIRIKDNGTARAVSFDSEYRAIGITLPTTTVLSKTMYLGCVRNVADTKWDVIGLSQEA